MKNNKTNAIRLLEEGGLSFEVFEYPDTLVDGQGIANFLHEDSDVVFKTLITENEKKEHFCFCVPVSCTLDLKKAAKAANSKSIEMIKQKDLLSLTGYIHGGCSPVGLKKPFPTFIDETAILYDSIYVSGGRRGCQIRINPSDLSLYVKAKFIDLIKI